MSRKSEVDSSDRLSLPTHDFRPSLAWFDDEANGGAVLVFNGDIDEGREADRLDARLAQVIARDRDGLDGLIGRSGADRLYLGPAALADDTGDGAGDGTRP